MSNYKFILSTFFYASGILLCSLQPDYPSAQSPDVWGQAIRNWLHVPAYAGLAALMVLTVAERSRNGRRTENRGQRTEDREQRAENGRRIFLSFILATSYGVLNEFVQAHVPGRFYSYEDMLRNALGAGIGIWVVGKWSKQARLISKIDSINAV